MEKQAHVFTPTGDLTICEVTTFRESVVALVADDKSWLLDLSQLRRVDAAGMQLLLAAERSGNFTLTGMSEELRHSLQHVGALAVARDAS